MREIRFRGQRLDYSKWVYGYLCPGSKINKTLFIVTYEHTWEVNPDTIGEYSGLKDKNGKEIYEGDIVNWVNTDGEILSSQKISFDSENGCWCIGCISFERFLQSGYVNQHHLEIIGNIFENPEFIPK